MSELKNKNRREQNMSQKADEILEKHDDVILSSKDYQFFLNVLNAERQNTPSKKSSRAAYEYRRCTGRN